MRSLGTAVILVAILALIPVQRPSAQSSLVWQTTFNCNDWNQQLGLGASIVNCDQMSGEGDWGRTMGPNGRGSEITALANYSGGGGGKGFRIYRADGFDVNSTGIWVNLPAGYSEMWARFYMRYQAGFLWTTGSPSFTKDVYMLGNSAPNFTMGFHGSNSWGLSVVNPQSDHWGTPGWQGAADGQFHCYEWHSKVGTTTSNGIAEVWVDNRQTVSHTNVNYNASGTWRAFALGENSSSPGNGREMAVDYDDVAVSITGRVGCFGTAPPPSVPVAPTNVRIIR